MTLGKSTSKSKNLGASQNFMKKNSSGTAKTVMSKDSNPDK